MWTFQPGDPCPRSEALDGENDPDPEVVHIPVVVPPLILPASCIDVAVTQIN